MKKNIFGNKISKKNSEKEKLGCDQIRELLINDWQQFSECTTKELESWIQRRFECSSHTSKKLARDFSGK